MRVPSRRTYQTNPVSLAFCVPGAMIRRAAPVSGSPLSVASNNARRLNGCSPTALLLAASVRPLTCTESSIAARLRAVCSVSPSTSLRAASTSSARAPR